MAFKKFSVGRATGLAFGGRIYNLLLGFRKQRQPTSPRRGLPLMPASKVIYLLIPMGFNILLLLSSHHRRQFFHNTFDVGVNGVVVYLHK